MSLQGRPGPALRLTISLQEAGMLVDYCRNYDFPATATLANTR